ncbi:MAG: hypothetical protein HY914_02365 [Desulfomonile tiedjei]|nr:hypothetical protein [Desulfomonile tiedjei]
MSTDRIVEEVEGDRQNFESLGCAVLMADGWRITLTALPSTRNLMRAFEGTTGYAITHLGRIEREDGALFTGRRAEDLLDALHYFLSFARGFWTPPILPVGLTSDGQLAWEQWVIGKTHAWEYVPSWFDAKHGQLLAKVFPGFWNLWSSEAWHDPLRESIDWYLRSNTNGGDMGIILSQAALERLTYAYAVPNQGLPKFFPCPEQKKAREKKHRKQTKFEDLPASRKIFEVFSRLEIPVEIPEQLRSMRRTAEERSRKCGPQAFTYMRNKIVHASTLRAKEWMTILYETWSLGQWYVELLLLRLCRHTGEYSNRLEPGRMGDVTPVPWAGNEIATHSIDLGPD